MSLTRVQHQSQGSQEGRFWTPHSEEQGPHDSQFVWWVFGPINKNLPMREFCFLFEHNLPQGLLRLKMGGTAFRKLHLGNQVIWLTR